jgi:hypothetical protein
MSKGSLIPCASRSSSTRQAARPNSEFFMLSMSSLSPWLPVPVLGGGRVCARILEMRFSHVGLHQPGIRHLRMGFRCPSVAISTPISSASTIARRESSSRGPVVHPNRPRQHYWRGVRRYRPTLDLCSSAGARRSADGGGGGGDPGKRLQAFVELLAEFSDSSALRHGGGMNRSRVA